MRHSVIFSLATAVLLAPATWIFLTIITVFVAATKAALVPSSEDDGSIARLSVVVLLTSVYVALLWPRVQGALADAFDTNP